jgi:hypothetical protein
MQPSVIFLGGNGHCAARLDAARRLAPFALHDVPYPGFEGRPRAASLDAFLDAVAASVTPGALLYATGIGGLFAVCLRARGLFLDAPLLLQGPVLWGLERRLMPRLMRLGLARVLLRRLFASSPFQGWFVRRYFESPPPGPLRRAFFDGYHSCTAAADFFDWLIPDLLRRLEVELKARPGSLERITVWWGGRDRVVTLRELELTENALGVRWPVRTFPHWGHYPMIDDPDGWVRELGHALADAATLPGPVGPQAG